MWIMSIRTFILNLLRRDDALKKLGPRCSFCAIVIGFDHTSYYMLNSKEYCSLNCYYDSMKVNTTVVTSSAEVPKKKKKGKKLAKKD